MYPSKNHIEIAMQNQVCYRSVELIGGNVLKKNETWLIRDSGGYAIVFPFIKSNGQKIVVRCWWADIGDPKRRMTSISSHLAKLGSPYFVGLKFHDKALLINGILEPIVTMDYVAEPTLKEYIEENLNNRSAILKVAENFKVMVSFFHKNNIAHGDLSHGNIKIRKDGSLIVIDYDSMYVQDLNGMPDVIKGLPGYQHPARRKNKAVNSKLDYFSELVIYLSLLVYADYKVMWKDYYGTEDLLFSRQDYEFPNESPLFKQLIISPNPQIVDLTKKLIECLNYDDISHLKPLEEMLGNGLEDLANSIISKF